MIRALMAATLMAVTAEMQMAVTLATANATLSKSNRLTQPKID